MAVGLLQSVQDNPAEGLQVYVYGACPPTTWAVKSTLLPLQTSGACGVISIVGLSYTITSSEAVAVQLLEAVTTTV